MSERGENGVENVQRQHTVEPLVENGEEKLATITYHLEKTPPIAVTLATAFQHILMTLPGCLYTAFAVSDAACAPYNHPVRASLFCGTLFMTGLCTFLQSFLGVRLPLFQGPSATFLIPLMSLQADPEWACSDEMLQSKVDSTNGTLSSSDENTDAEIYTKLQKMSGALMLASLSEILIGSIGILGPLLRFIGPITVAITISLIGVSLAKLPIMYSRPNFPLALGCMVLILIFVLYCQNFKLPIPRCTKKQREESTHKRSFKVFQFIPILIGVTIMWIVSFILTLCGVFTDDKSSIHYYARTDAKMDVVARSPWFQVTYPGMFGIPKMSVALATGFTISCISSLVESVGDYYAAHKACEVVPPPNHAISRGVLVEGLGSFISGAVGVGHATTSYSGNISILTLSKTASRSVMYAAGFILMLMSLVGKVGAALTTIPNPILGGVSILVNATLVSIGLQNLKHVDMSLTRNLLVVGMPFMCGLTVPMCVEMYPELIDTGHAQANQVIHVIVSSPMFLGGIVALILDNTVPGSYECRGMVDPNDSSMLSEGANNPSIYSWSIYPKITKVFPSLSYLPFLPPRTPSRDLESKALPHDLESNVVSVNITRLV